MTAPTAAAWELALAGIGQLERKLDAQGETLRDLQDQLTDVRAAYTRAAPMISLIALEGRVVALESGATAAILKKLDSDHAERGERRRQTDARDRRLLLALAALALAVLTLAAVIYLGGR